MVTPTMGYATGGSMRRIRNIAIGILALTVTLPPAATAANAVATARTAVEAAVAATATRLDEAPIALEIQSAGARTFAFQRDEEGTRARFADGVQHYQQAYLAVFPYRADALSRSWSDTLQFLGITGPYDWIAEDREDFVPNDAASTAFAKFLSDVQRIMAKASKAQTITTDTSSKYVFTQSVTIPGPKVKGKPTKKTGTLTASVTVTDGSITELTLAASSLLAKANPTRTLTIAPVTGELTLPESGVLNLHDLDMDPAVALAMTKVAMLDAARAIVVQAQVYARAAGRAVTGADLERSRQVQSSEFDAFTRIVGDALQIIANPGSDVQLVLCASSAADNTMQTAWAFCPE